jgi:hypothetical protein
MFPLQHTELSPLIRIMALEGLLLQSLAILWHWTFGGPMLLATATVALFTPLQVGVFLNGRKFSWPIQVAASVGVCSLVYLFLLDVSGYSVLWFAIVAGTLLVFLATGPSRMWHGLVHRVLGVFVPTVLFLPHWCPPVSDRMTWIQLAEGAWIASTGARPWFSAGWALALVSLITLRGDPRL